MEEKYKKFIAKLQKANADFDYDYSYTEYGSRKDKVSVVCNKHGPFIKTVQQLERGIGCPCCIKKKTKQKAQKSFIRRASKLHSGKYTYTKVDYNTNKQNVVITCPYHGDFTQTPDNHLANHGCKKCQYENIKLLLTKTTDKFIEEAKKVHGNVYDYSLVEYKNSNTKVKIVLPSGDIAEQLPSHHLAGFSPSIEPRGLDYNRPGILYYLKIATASTTLYKIGITTKTVQERFTLKDLKSIEVLHQKSYSTIKEAFRVEQKILKQYKNFQYTGDPVLESNGNTEIFTQDIFKGIYNEIDSMGEF